MLRLESIQKRLTPLPHPTLAQSPDPTEFILNCPEEFFAELGERVFPVGRGIWLSETAPIRVDLLALDEAGRSIVVAFERRHQQSALNDALLCASLIAQWKVQDFFNLVGSPRADELREFLCVDSSLINRTQRVILISEHYNEQMLSTTQWLARNYGIDISCVHIATSWDSQVRRGYLSCNQVFSSLTPPKTTKPSREIGPQVVETPKPSSDDSASLRMAHTAAVGAVPPPSAGAAVADSAPPPSADSGVADSSSPASEDVRPADGISEQETPQEVTLTVDSPSITTGRLKWVLLLAVLCVALELVFTFAPRPGTTTEPIAVAGSVTDRATGQPIREATLYYAGEQASTDADGRFRFPIEPGQGTLVVRAAGYRERELEVTADGLSIDLEPRLAPPNVWAVYLSQAHMSNAERRARIQRIVESTSVNAVVLDVKTPGGYLSLPVDHPLAREIGALERLPRRELASEVQRWKREGIYTIAHVALFRDNLLAGKRPDLALKSLRTKKPVKDASGLGWTDPAGALVREYNVAVATAAARAGFDEVQFDFARYPASRLSAEGTDPEENERRLAAVVEFFRQARQALKPHNVFLATTVLGSVCSVRKPGFIGQKLEEFAAELDVVSPMLYPSTFSPGRGGSDPLNRSYELVHENLKEAASRLGGNSAKLRPWLQNFHNPGSSVGYPNAQAIRAQISAATDAESSGWMLWDGTNRYRNTLEALRGLEDQPPDESTQRE